jgi:hypothetical protein
MDIRPSPIQDAFIRSPATVACLIGPQGEGKTWAGAIAMFLAGQRWKAVTGKPMPGAIVRDTHANIKRMTVGSINKAMNAKGVGTLIRWKSDYHKLTSIDGSMDIDLFGMDDLGSLTRIQGAEYAFIWMEEPAPMIEQANAGMSVEVFDACISRVSRAINVEHAEAGLLPRLQVTMNPADEEHWTYHEFLENPRFPSRDFPDLSLKVFNIPYGDNTYQADMTRQATKAAFMNDQGLYMRYVDGRFAFVQIGEKVTPEYNEEIHRAKVKLDPIPGADGYRFWDGGLNPTCIVAQVTPRGRVHVLDTWVGENMGLRQLLKNHVKPTLESPRYAESRIPRWRDIGDPALRNREQSDSDQTGARVIETELGGTFEPGPIDWWPRREGCKDALSRLIDGGPMVLVSPHEGKLNRALRGGWHYRKDASGKVIRDQAVKDMHSHPGDAFGYGMAVILGKHGAKQRTNQSQLRHYRDATE